MALVEGAAAPGPLLRPACLTAGLEQALQWLDVLLVGMLAGNAASRASTVERFIIQARGGGYGAAIVVIVSSSCIDG